MRFEGKSKEKEREKRIFDISNLMTCVMSIKPFLFTNIEWNICHCSRKKKQIEIQYTTNVNITALAAHSSTVPSQDRRQ